MLESRRMKMKINKISFISLDIYYVATYSKLSTYVLMLIITKCETNKILDLFLSLSFFMSLLVFTSFELEVSKCRLTQ